MLLVMWKDEEYTIDGTTTTRAGGESVDFLFTAQGPSEIFGIGGFASQEERDTAGYYIGMALRENWDILNLDEAILTPPPVEAAS